MNKINIIYRKLVLPNMFPKGFGNPDLLLQIIENHKVVSNRETCKHIVKYGNITFTTINENSRYKRIAGSFQSPLHYLLPNAMDEKNQRANFQLIIPKSWKSKYKPLCIHYAGTGDHNFFRRKVFLADRLLSDGIASLIHINPFYGNRKPKDQRGSSLNYLSDLFVMGGGLILETQFLLQWAKKEGFGPLALHGISMGGHMACLSASVYPEPVCLIPCLSWTTASHVFTEGAMSSSVSWNVLSDQYNSDETYRKEIRSAINPPIPQHLKSSERKTEASFNSNFCICVNNKFNSFFDGRSHNIQLSALYKEGQRNELSNFNHNPMKPDDKDLYLTTCSTSTDINSRIRSPGSISYLNPVAHASHSIKSEIENIGIFAWRLKQKQILDKLLLRPPQVDRDTIDFMRDLLNFLTHLGNYSAPLDTRIVTVVAARKDAFIPIEGVAHFHDVWGECCDIRVREGFGHIQTYLRNCLSLDHSFRQGIVDTMNRYVELYYNEPGPFGQ